MANSTKMRYLKYYISPLTLVLALYTCTLGSLYPTAFFVGFSLFIILGDIIIKEDLVEASHQNQFILNLPIEFNYSYQNFGLFGGLNHISMTLTY